MQNTPNDCMNFLEGASLDWRQLQNREFKPQITLSVGRAGRQQADKHCKCTQTMFWEGSCSLPVLLFVLLSFGHSRHLQWAPDKRMRTKIFYQMEAWFCLAHKNCTRTETSNCLRCAAIRYSRKRKYNSQRTRLTDPVPILSTRMPSPRQSEVDARVSLSTHPMSPPLPRPPSDSHTKADSLCPTHCTGLFKPVSLFHFKRKV